MRIPTPVGSRPPSRTRAPPSSDELDLSHLSLSPPELGYGSSLSPPQLYGGHLAGASGVGESPPLATPPTPALFRSLARGKARLAEPEEEHAFRDGFSNSYGLWRGDGFELDDNDAGEHGGESSSSHSPEGTQTAPRGVLTPPPAPARVASPPPQLPAQTFAPLYSPTSAPGGTGYNDDDSSPASSMSISTTSSRSRSGSASLGAAVRRRLDSSKRLFRRGEDEGAAPGTATPAAVTLEADPSPMSRLRSTLRPRARTNSGSMNDSSSSFFTSFAISPAASTSSAASSPVLRSFPPPPDDSNMEQQQQQQPQQRHKLFRPRGQGLRRRSTLGLAGLSLTQLEQPLQPRPFSVVVSSAGVRAHAPEATTPVGTDELVWGTLSYRAVPEPVKVDLFSTMLPRELKVAVFKALLNGWKASGAGARLEGENGGRRELIRLSRVSS